MADLARRRWLTAAVVAIAALVIAGVGVASWAGSGPSSGAASGETAPASATVETRDTDATPGKRGHGASEATSIDCEDARTHGEYVSAVARSTPGGPGKGAVVSAAARSDCGKPARE